MPSHHKNGINHWIYQRLSAVGLLALSLWFVWAISYHGPLGYGAIRAWIQEPLSFVLLSLYLGGMAYHGLLGVRVVAEDYITCLARRNAVIWGGYSVSALMTIYGWVQLLTIYSRGLTQAS